MKTTQQIESFFLGFTISAIIFGAILALVLSNKPNNNLILEQTNKELLRKLRKANTDIIAAREIIQGNKLGTLIYR